MNFKEYLASRGDPKTIRCALGFHNVYLDEDPRYFRLVCKRCNYHWPEDWMIHE